MPIEINELVVRTVIEPKPNSSHNSFQPQQREKEERQELIKECVKNVLKILKNKMER